MTSSMRKVLALAALLGGGFALAAEDPALLGCWRSQQSQMTLADKSTRQQNGDCVAWYDATRQRSRGHQEFDPASVDCDEPDKVCAHRRFPDGGQCYIELVNVKGRVAVVHASLADKAPADHTGLLRSTARLFADQLLRSNAP